MKRNEEILFLFDVDGTLTPSRQIATKEMLEHLISLKSKVSIGFVGGSDLAKQREQVDLSIIDSKYKDILELFDYSFPENGLSFYRNTELISQESINSFLGEQTLQKIINESLSFLSKVELPVKRGNFIELRDSMLNVSPVGRSCSHEERLAFFSYDQEHSIRNSYCTHMRKMFPNVSFVIGGQISVDVFPRGWDKTYCLRHLIPSSLSQFESSQNNSQSENVSSQNSAKNVSENISCLSNEMSQANSLNQMNQNMVEKIKAGNQSLTQDKIKKIFFFGDMIRPGQNDYEIYSHPLVEGVAVSGPDDTIEKSNKILEQLNQ